MQFQAWVLFACLLQSVLAQACEPLPSFAAEKGWSTITDHGFVQQMLLRRYFYSFPNALYREGMNLRHSRRIGHLGTFLILITWLFSRSSKDNYIGSLRNKESKLPVYLPFKNTVFHFALVFNQAAALKTSSKTVYSAVQSRSIGAISSGAILCRGAS